MKKRLQSNLILKIVSVLIAVALWFVFLNENNPYKEKTFVIPIHVVNYDTLSEKGLFLKNEYVDNVAIVVKGREKTLEKVTNSDFSLTVDFSKLESSGKKRIVLGLPEFNINGIKVDSVEPPYLDLDIGRQGNREVEVELVFEGEVADRYKILNVTQVPETIIIDGEADEISKVARAKAFINVDGLKSSFSTKKEVLIFDADGIEITKLRNKHIVDVKVEIGKEIMLVADIVGSPNENYYYKSIELNPRTIFVIGDSDALDKLKSISTSKIDISELDKNKVFDFTPVVPFGVKAADGYSFGTAKVSIGNIITKNITLDTDSILLVGSDLDKYTYNVSPNSVTVSIRGRDADLELFSGDDLQARINVTDLTKSPTKELDVIIEAPVNVEVLTRSTVKLDIGKK